MEELMQFVWEHKLWFHTPLFTSADNLPVKIINPGIKNSDAGPDFFNASVKIGNQRWVGNIELHLRASDWYRHGHDRDRAYDSVILHVVQVDDMPVKRPDGAIIPQITVRCTPEAANRCNMLMASAAASLPCAETVRQLPRIFHTEWLTALAVERLYHKSERILQLVEFTEGDWEAAAYITMARALGFGLNSEPFEVLAKNLPLRFLNRHRDELITMEALIFGMAGLIPPPQTHEEPYLTRLRQEFLFMARKFSLHAPSLQWKLSRTRPQNFPHRRLAILAEKVHQGFSLIGGLDDIISDLRQAQAAACHESITGYGHVPELPSPYLPSLTEIRRQFDIRLSGFWGTHFTFSPGGGATPRALSDASIDKMVINVAIPLLMARAQARGDIETIETVPELLRCFQAENNKDVRLFKNADIQCRDAFDSQALIHLRREYCEKQKCILCRFGHRMLSREIQS